MTGTMNDDDDGEWLTISEAAARLGVRPVAIRRRIQRKTLRVRPAERENDGRTRVWVARTAELDPKNWTEGLALVLISALRERTRTNEQDPSEPRIGV